MSFCNLDKSSSPTLSHRELVSVPDELRVVLEQCLSEEATAENLEIYLPNVRKIITNLLQGLREKQTIYRKIMTDHRRQPDGSDKTEIRHSRNRREVGYRSESRTASATEDGSIQRDSTRRSAQSSQRRRDVTSQSSQGSLALPASADEQQQMFVGGFAPRIPEQYPPDALPPIPPSANDSISLQHRKGPSTAFELSEAPLPELPVESNVSPATMLVPASVKRYSLIDKPVPATPPVIVEPSSPEAATEQLNEASSQQAESTPIETMPAVADSLAALKKSDVLERRASKRFSTYNISKITSNNSARKSLRGNLNRRSLAASNALTSGELAVLAEVDDEDGSEMGEHSKSLSRPVTPPVPPLPTMISSPELETIAESVSKPVPSTPSSKISVFLQLGREVKKISIEPGFSFAGLRVLFVDKFAYNPGLENFPAIYIRDPASGVQYELEDVDEVKEKCLLSLNIERELLLYLFIIRPNRTF